MSATCLSGERLASMDSAVQPSSPAAASNPNTMSCWPGCAPTGFEYATFVSPLDPLPSSLPHATMATAAVSAAAVAVSLTIARSFWRKAAAADAERDGGDEDR